MSRLLSLERAFSYANAGKACLLEFRSEARDVRSAKKDWKEKRENERVFSVENFADVTSALKERVALSRYYFRLFSFHCLVQLHPL